MIQSLKSEVLSRIGARDARRVSSGAFQSKSGSIHVRFKTAGPFSFNVNPATLACDWEVWICGSAETFYVVPMETIRRMYEHPKAYVDRRHPEIRVISIDIDRHRATFARAGESVDLRGFFLATLPMTEDASATRR